LLDPQAFDGAEIAIEGGKFWTAPADRGQDNGRPVSRTTVRLRVKVTGARTEIELPPVPGKPKAFKFNDLEGVLSEVKEVPW
jgi:hypothetical protein